MILLSKYMQLLQSEQTFVEVYTDRYNDSDYGFVLDYNDDFLLLEKYSGNSIYEGIVVFKRENITRVRWDGNDIINTWRFIDSAKRPDVKDSISLNTIKSVIETIQARFGYVTLHVEDIDSDVCYIGQVHEIDEETIILHEFGTKGTMDRKYLLLSLTHISKVEAGGLYEKILERIFIG